MGKPRKFAPNNTKKIYKQKEEITMCLSVSAVRVIFRRCAIQNTVYNISRNMSLDWEPVKMKYQEMNLDEKRALYKCGSSYITVDQLPTWEEYFKTKTSLAEKIDILGGYEIDASKNAELMKKISIFNGDITRLEIDAIVNAANTTLMGGGGVDGAIHQAAGPDLKKECGSLNRCEVGQAKITGGYKLPAKYIIHTVGPQKEKPDMLTACYRNCLDIALHKNIRTLAFPCISTGIYGYPIDKAAHVAIRQVRIFLEKNPNEVDRIIFCLFLPADVTMYEGALQSYFPVS